MPTIHSGGAEGADTAFANIGLSAGFEVVHHSFAGHQTKAMGKILKHTAEELKLADKFLHKANLTLKRSYPPRSQYVQKLLQRNYYQVRNSQFVVAVAPLETNKIVSGGTGWAVQMGIDMRKRVFVFDDRETNAWYIYDFTRHEFWPLGYRLPPNTGNFAGIGSRKISPDGIAAIQELLAQGD